MRKHYTAVTAILCTLLCAAQNDVKTVKTGEQISDVFTVKDIFRYPSFLQGRVLFRDGTTADAQLNYNRYFEQIMFLDPKGDSLAIGSPELINVISVGNDNYAYAGETVVEIKADYDDVKLAAHEMLREVDKKVLGAYGSTSTASSIPYYKHDYTVDGKPIQQKPGEGTLFSRATSFYIGDSFNHFVPLNKKSLEAAYAKKSKELKAYLKENSIRYDNESDLQQLMQHMRTQ